MIFTQTRYLTTFSLITCSCSHVCFREIPRRISIRACYQDFESSRKYILRPNSKFHFELYKSVCKQWMKCARDWFARALTMCALVITRRYRLHDFLDIFSFCDVKFSFFFLPFSFSNHLFFIWVLEKVYAAIKFAIGICQQDQEKLLKM